MIFIYKDKNNKCHFPLISKVCFKTDWISHFHWINLPLKLRIDEMTNADNYCAFWPVSDTHSPFWVRGGCDVAYREKLPL